MNGMSPFSTDQWTQQYPNTAMAESGGEPYDATTCITVHQDSTQGTAGQAGAKIRRRSRASRKAPTTLLTASPTDFRALVQRFTGCNSGVDMSSTSASNVNFPKGPLNIDFTKNDMNGSSSKYTYFDNQLTPPLEAEQMQSVGGLSDLQAGHGMVNASVDYEVVQASTRRNGGSQEYNF